MPAALLGLNISRWTRSVSSGSSQSSVGKADRSIVTPQLDGHDGILCEAFRGRLAQTGMTRQLPGEPDKDIGTRTGTV